MSEGHSRNTTTVLIPTYQRPQQLKLCLQALESQTCRPDQVLVVLRKGDQGSRAVLQGYQDQRQLRVQAVYIDRPGKAAAVNAALGKAVGDILCFTDDDAIPHNDWLERLVEHYTDPTVGGCGGKDLVYINGERQRGHVSIVGQVTWYGKIYHNHHLDLETDSPFPVDILKGVNMSFRRQLVTPLDEKLLGETPYFEENDTCLKIRRQGYQLIYDPRILVDHYPTPERVVENSQRNYLRPAMAYAVSFNNTYMMLKNLPFIRRCIFIVFTFVIGTADSLGVMRALWGFITERNYRYVLVLPAAVTGKLNGIGSYLMHLRSH